MDVRPGGYYCGEGAAMNDREVLGYIAASRQSLDRSLQMIRARTGLCPSCDPVISRLIAQQEQLERAAGIDLSGGRLGFGVTIPFVAGGMALIGLATWAWKQHRETSRFEAYQDCLKRLEEAGGYSETEAAMICSGNYGGTAQSISEILKYAVILTAGIAGVYLLMRVVK